MANVENLAASAIAPRDDLSLHAELRSFFQSRLDRIAGRFGPISAERIWSEALNAVVGDIRFPKAAFIGALLTAIEGLVAMERVSPPSVRAKLDEMFARDQRRAA